MGSRGKRQRKSAGYRGRTVLHNCIADKPGYPFIREPHPALRCRRQPSHHCPERRSVVSIGSCDRRGRCCGRNLAQSACAASNALRNSCGASRFIAGLSRNALRVRCHRRSRDSNSGVNAGACNGCDPGPHHRQTDTASLKYLPELAQSRMSQFSTLQIRIRQVESRQAVSGHVG